MMDKTYIDTARLLLESVPVIFETPHFAMKGGTAINLFVQNMPRLSVALTWFIPTTARCARRL